MPRVATAVLEIHADAIRAELVKNDPEKRFTSLGYRCGRCGAPFVIFFVDGLDEYNEMYAIELEETIVLGCEMDRHPFEEYPLERP